MEINRLNVEVNGMLPFPIFWTGFKLGQFSVSETEKAHSQIGWFGKDGKGFARLNLSKHEIDAAKPEEVAEKIKEIWTREMNLAEPEAVALPSDGPDIIRLIEAQNAHRGGKTLS